MPALGIPPPCTSIALPVSGLPSLGNCLLVLTPGPLEDVASDLITLSSQPRQSLATRPPLFPATPRDTAQRFSPHYHPTFGLLSLCS